MKLTFFGRHSHRFRDNPEEKRIAEAWNRTCAESQTLAWLLDRRADQTGQPMTPSDIEITAASTVIQWLGSPVGQFWLQSLGYERRPSQPSGTPVNAGSRTSEKK